MSIKIAMTLLSICCILLSIITLRHTIAIRNIQKQIDDNTIAEILNDIEKWRTWSHTYDNACMDRKKR